MGRRSTWHTEVVKRAVAVVDPQGNTHLWITDRSNATWWPEKSGRINRDADCLIETSWNESVVSGTQVGSPIRRRSATREVGIGGRRYVYRHTSDRRSVVERDGQQIAKLHKSWQLVFWGRRASFKDLGFTMDAPPVLDPLDEAMIVAFGAVLGPPGHEGGVTTVCRVVPAVMSELP